MKRMHGSMVRLGFDKALLQPSRQTGPSSVNGAPNGKASHGAGLVLRSPPRAPPAAQPGRHARRHRRTPSRGRLSPHRGLVAKGGNASRLVLLACATTHVPGVKQVKGENGTNLSEHAAVSLVRPVCCVPCLASPPLARGACRPTSMSARPCSPPSLYAATQLATNRGESGAAPVGEHKSVVWPDVVCGFFRFHALVRPGTRLNFEHSLK